MPVCSVVVVLTCGPVGDVCGDDILIVVTVVAVGITIKTAFNYL